MLTALLRYLLVLEHGRGAAPEEVFASRPRAAAHRAVLARRVRSWGLCQVTCRATADAGDRPDLPTVMALVADVDGWMSPGQASTLYDAATRCPAGGSIVEIGSFRGRSTIVLASAPRRTSR